MVDEELNEIIEKLHVTATMIADKIRYIRLYGLSKEKQQDLEFLNNALNKTLYAKYLLLATLEKQYNGEIPPYITILEEVKATINDILPEVSISIDILEKKIVSKTINISELKNIAEKDMQEAKKILLQYWIVVRLVVDEPEKIVVEIDINYLKELLSTFFFKLPLASFLQVELEKCNWDLDLCDDATKYLVYEFIEFVKLLGY